MIAATLDLIVKNQRVIQGVAYTVAIFGFGALGMGVIMSLWKRDVWGTYLSIVGFCVSLLSLRRCFH